MDPVTVLSGNFTHCFVEDDDDDDDDDDENDDDNADGNDDAVFIVFLLIIITSSSSIVIICIIIIIVVLVGCECIVIHMTWVVLEEAIPTRVIIIAPTKPKHYVCVIDHTVYLWLSVRLWYL